MLNSIDNSHVAASAPVVRCVSCGQAFGELTPHTTCPDCHGFLEVVPAAIAVTGGALRAVFDARVDARVLQTAGAARSGVWRFRELLLSDRDAVSHGEGNTPLIVSSRVATYAGVASLRLKHEGYNPTGSFKDRGMTVAVTQAARVGARAVACASTGNTSASLAAYAALAGLRALVLVPAGHVSPAKLAQTCAYGARVLAVRGDFDACLRLVRDASERLGVYLANSVNPFRIEGQKTIMFELLQQLSWEAPDWIAFPAGNLGNASAFGKALREAHAAGLIDRVPRLAAIQASGAAPFARAFAGGFRERRPVEPQTVATAIRIGDPASWDRAVESIRYTNGVALAVSDDDILSAKRAIDRAGIGCEPASAASVAGIRALRGQGVIAEDDRVVAVLTGHLLKDAGAPPDTGITEIDADVTAVERIISASGA
jgi:threonine synthase